MDNGSKIRWNMYEGMLMTLPKKKTKAYQCYQHISCIYTMWQNVLSSRGEKND